MEKLNLNLIKLKTKNINYRKYLIKKTKLRISTITRLSYDLQSGNYIKNYKILKRNKKNYKIFLKNIKNLNEKIKLKNIKTILDFGTGEGIKLPYLLRFNKSVKKIYACDISFNRLYYAKVFLKRRLNKREMSKLSLFCNKDFCSFPHQYMYCQQRHQGWLHRFLLTLQFCILINYHLHFL